MRKRFRPVSAVSLLVVMLGASVAVSGCGRYSFTSLKAKKAYNEANEHYKAGRWRDAADRYEAAAAGDPALPGVYFFMANSYDNLYRPGRAGEPENDALIYKAIEHYRTAADQDADPKMRKLAMDYLVAAYGPDKLNDPAEAEPIVQKMIEMEPNEPINLFALSKIYEDAGRYEEAEEALLKAREVAPQDPAVYATLSGFYNRQGEFDKTMESLHQAAELRPTDPQGHQLVATYYWEKAHKDHRLNDKVKREYILRGISATDKALSLNPDYAEALTYKNILLRMQANLETDRTRQQQLLKEADDLRNRAMELNKRKTTGGP